MEKTKKIYFLSNMILQPIGKELKSNFKCNYADLDSIIPTLTSKIDTDYLVLILDSRFFYDSFIDENSKERVEFLKGLLKEFRSLNRAKILLGNLDDNLFSIDTSSQLENRKKLEELNSLIDNFKREISDLEILDIYELARIYGKSRLYNEKNRYLFQSPYTKEGVKVIAKSIKEAIERFETKRRKLIAVDADNTLWGGIVGEDGVDGILCDENFPGIAYKRLQQFLLYLKSTGIILALVSKNNEEDIKEVFSKKKMPLTLDDFTTIRVNWKPKSQNILSIADELNLGADSFLFLDDNPFELEEVKRVIDNIATVQVDKENPLNTIEELQNRADIQSILITDEDRKKSEQYKAEKARSAVFKKALDIESFIKSLNIKITWWLNNRSQLSRITQLINKTNQFNLTTRRYTEAEVEELMNHHEVFSFKVEDNFGDMGIVGVVIVKEGKIDTFLLSCRVLGRGIEDRVMDIVVQNSSKLKEAEFIPSQKNAQVESLYDKLGFELVKKEEDGRKLYRFIKKEPKREFIKIERGEQ